MTAVVYRTISNALPQNFPAFTIDTNHLEGMFAISAERIRVHEV